MPSKQAALRSEDPRETIPSSHIIPQHRKVPPVIIPLPPPHSVKKSQKKKNARKIRPRKKKKKGARLPSPQSVNKQRDERNLTHSEDHSTGIKKWDEVRQEGVVGNLVRDWFVCFVFPINLDFEDRNVPEGQIVVHACFPKKPGKFAARQALFPPTPLIPFWSLPPPPQDTPLGCCQSGICEVTKRKKVK